MEVEIVPNSCRPIICPYSSSLCGIENLMRTREDGYDVADGEVETMFPPECDNSNNLFTGECTKTIMYTLKFIVGIRTGGWIPLLIRCHLINLLMNRDTYYYAIRQGWFQKHRNCYHVVCYVIIKSIEKTFVSLISPNTKDKEISKRAEDHPTCPFMDLYRVIDLIKCII